MAKLWPLRSKVCDVFVLMNSQAKAMLPSRHLCRVNLHRVRGAAGLVRWVGLVGLALGSGLCACAKAAPVSQFPDAPSALGRMKQTYACASGVQGDGKLDHVSREGRIRGDVMMMAADPARMRFDVVSPFGVLLATLTSDGERFTFFDMQNGQFLHGPPEPCNIARLTQVRLPAHVLVKLLRGEAPLIVYEPSTATIEWSSSGYYEVRVRGKYETEQLVHLEPHPRDYSLPYHQQRVRVLRVRVMQRDYVHFDALLLDHERARTMPARVDELGIDPPVLPSGPACEAEVPRRIQMTVPYTGDDMRFRYEQVGLNPPLPEGVFTQPVPDGVRRRFVTCH